MVETRRVISMVPHTKVFVALSQNSTIVLICYALHFLKPHNTTIQALKKKECTDHADQGPQGHKWHWNGLHHPHRRHPVGTVAAVGAQTGH